MAENRKTECSFAEYSVVKKHFSDLAKLFQPHLTELAGKFLSSSLIGDNELDNATNNNQPTSDRATTLLSNILKRIELNKTCYYTLVNALKEFPDLDNMVGILDSHLKGASTSSSLPPASGTPSQDVPPHQGSDPHNPNSSKQTSFDGDSAFVEGQSVLAGPEGDEIHSSGPIQIESDETEPSQQVGIKLNDDPPHVLFNETDHSHCEMKKYFLKENKRWKKKEAKYWESEHGKCLRELNNLKRKHFQVSEQFKKDKHDQERKMSELKAKFEKKLNTKVETLARSLVVMQEREKESREELAVVQERERMSREELAVVQERERESREELAVMQDRERMPREELAVMQERERKSREELAVMQERERKSREELAVINCKLIEAEKKLRCTKKVNTERLNMKMEALNLMQFGE